jgi:hypothetical protein
MISMNCRPPLAIAVSSAARLPAAKALIRNRSRRTMGSATLVSATQKAASSPMPAAMPPSTHGLVQPVAWPPYGWIPWVIATRIAAVPAVKVTLPTQSMRARWRAPTSRRLRYDQTVPPMPNGTLTQNTARQSIAASRPPATRPRN